MNMHSSVEGRIVAGDPTAICAQDLLRVALDIIDGDNLPGEIGAHLDMAINMLSKHLATGPAVPAARP